MTPTDITENTIHDTPRKLSPLGEKVGRVVPAKTILVTCIASIGKNTMLENKGSFNQQINGSVPDKNNFDPYFLLTESYHWSAKMKRDAAAGTMQLVNKNEFSSIKTYVPSLPEQKIIGLYFQNLDHLITLHQRKYFHTRNILNYIRICLVTVGKETKEMPELESMIENKLIEQLAYGDSQWTYRPDLKTEEDL